MLVALNEMAGYDPLVGATYRNLLTAITGRATRVIEDGQADGSIRPELPATTTASALTWMVERACQQNLPTPRDSYDAELAEAAGPNHLGHTVSQADFGELIPYTATRSSACTAGRRSSPGSSEVDRPIMVASSAAS